MDSQKTPSPGHEPQPLAAGEVGSFSPARLPDGQAKGEGNNVFKSIAGHKKQLEFLERSIKRGKLAHAYIFGGPEDVGKKTIAFKLAQTLLCENNSICNSCKQCKAFVMANNADFLSVRDEAGIKIEQIRDLIYKLSLKPYMARYKVAVIEDADSMNLEAANALLKNLEEPKPYTIIILITSAPDRLLKTIASRAQKVSFGPVGFGEYKHLLPVQLSTQQKNLIALHAQESPGLALQIASNEEFLANLGEIEKKYATFRSRDLIERMSLVSDLADLETHALKDVLNFWSGRLRNELKANPNKNFVSSLRSLIAARSYLELNVNTKLLLSNLMLQNLDV